MTAWVSRELQPQHDLAGFDCGKEPLNAWLTQQSRRAQEAGTARTYVWTASGSDTARAYYSIAPTQVVRDGLTRSQTGGYSIIPAYLLARLAIDQSLHGRGLGAELLFDAVDRMVRAAAIGGGRLIVVDALDDNAAKFYLRHDFTPIKNNPRRLVMTMATARAALGVEGPGPRMLSLVLDTHEGTTAPVALSPTELRTVATVMESMNEPETSEATLRAAITAAIGRDPFRKS
ncbi:GNAT family protein [Actinoplanes awajinensis]|uniref:GNAT family N-acetyltransferase n=1 Tax=Actinoplanes awajinensis TaxID=135946 RepID=UPI000834C137|nr:GNAT family N-acetyltransferase [Actinoplanes awajinensis]